MRRGIVLLSLAVLLLAPMASVRGSGVQQLTPRALLPFTPVDMYTLTDHVDASINIVNTDTLWAYVEVCFYSYWGGTETCPSSLATSEGTVGNHFQLSAGESVEILPFLTAGLTSDRYSAVVYADEEVAAIVNLTTWIGQAGAPYYNASYNGTPADGVSVRYLPSVVELYYDWDSYVGVQNMASTAQDLSMEVFTEGSSTVCWSGTDGGVPGYAPVDGIPAGLVGLCDVNGDGYNGSGRASSAGPVTAMVWQIANTTVYGPAGRAQAYSGFGPSGTILYAPALYYGYYGWDSSINVQNLGLNDTTVDVTYSDGYHTSYILPAGAAHLFYQFSEGQAGHHTAGSRFSAAIVSGGEQIAAVVNAATTQPWPGNWAPRDQAQTYSAPSSSDGSMTLVFPQIMREYYGWYTSYTIQNVGPTMISVAVSYDGVPECQDRVVGPIAPGTNVEIYQGGELDQLCPSLPGSPQPGNPNAASYRGAVTVRTIGTGSIVGIVNQTNFYHRSTTGETGDWSMAYNGLNR